MRATTRSTSFKSEVAELKATPRNKCAKIEYDAKPRE